MPVRVAEVDAAILAGTPADRDPALFQFGFQRLVGPRRHVERQMIEVLSSGQRRIARVLEQGETLLSGTQEDLSLVFPVYSHPEYFSVKQLRPLHVIDVEHDVVDSARFDHWSPLGSLVQWLGHGEPPHPAHCLSAASAIPIKAAADNQLPLRCEAEARK